MRPCFKITAAATADRPTVISVFEDIGFWGTQAKDFIAAVNSSQSDIQVEINSPGGDVFAAMAMYNALRASGKSVTTKVMGVAASAASLVFMAGDKRVMPANTFVMVHNPSTYVFGNADELDEASAVLRKVGASVQATYAARTSLEDGALTEMLATDTWLTAEECMVHGFATEVIDDVTATASFDMDRAALPESVRSVYASAQQPSPVVIETSNEAEPLEFVDPVLADQINAVAHDAGLTAYATYFAVACASMPEAHARIKAAREITAICAMAKRPDDAHALIKTNKTVAQAREAILTAMAEADEHIDATPPSKPARSSATAHPDPARIWQSHNSQTMQSRKDKTK